MRALLVVNPKATTTSPRGRDVIARALGSELKVDVRETTARGHATELAREAAADGHDVVVALGGDGTVNEVVNGLLADGVRPDAPALGVVPGGSANVFVRSLGGPRNPVDATADLLAALRAGRTRSIGVGRAEVVTAAGVPPQTRWFTFCAGLGFDAEVVEMVERLRGRGRPASPALYVASAVRHFFLGVDRRHPSVTLHVPGEPPVGPLALAIVANTSPWTYLGARPVHPLPRASFDTGLDLLAPRSLGTARTLALLAGMLTAPTPAGRPGLRDRAPWLGGVERRHDLEAFTVECTRPLALQVDGDLLGPVERVAFTSVPRALRVVA